MCAAGVCVNLLSVSRISHTWQTSASCLFTTPRLWGKARESIDVSRRGGSFHEDYRPPASTALASLHAVLCFVISAQSTALASSQNWMLARWRTLPQNGQQARCCSQCYTPQVTRSDELKRKESQGKFPGLSFRYCQCRIVFGSFLVGHML